MTAREERFCESSESFLSHLEDFHPTCLDDVNHIPIVTKDMQVFRSVVCGLPQAEVKQVISCVQEVCCTHQMIRPPYELVLTSICSHASKCIDHCPMGRNSMSQGLKLLQDFSSSSGLLPDSYWIDYVTGGDRISFGGEASVHVGRHRDRAVAIRRFHVTTARDNLTEVCRA